MAERGLESFQESIWHGGTISEAKKSKEMLLGVSSLCLEHSLGDHSVRVVLETDPDGSLSASRCFVVPSRPRLFWPFEHIQLRYTSQHGCKVSNILKGQAISL